MAVNLGELKLKIIGLLGEDPEENSDPIAGALTPASMLKDAVHAALLALSFRYWKSAVLEVVEDAEATTTPYPEDAISVEAVYDNKVEQFITRTFMAVGQSMITSQIQNSWSDYPNGVIAFVNPLSKGGKIYYSAYWALPEADDDALEPPMMCLTFIALYAASYCLLRKASEQAETSQFKTKIDSGTPVMLPAQVLSDSLLKRAEIEAQRLPMKQKGTN